MHIPLATYRIQFNPDFGFSAARNIVSYLSGLGISDLYASPIFKARQGSTHGYDVVDTNQVNPELGSGEDFDSLIRELRNHKMGWIQDIVPNHMAFDSENFLLMDVLENGPESEYFEFFDIDWEYPYERVRGKVLAPFLGKFYGECLESGELKLSFSSDGLAVNYFDWRFPLRLDSYGKFFTRNLARLRRKLGSNQPEYVKMLGILYSLKNLSSKSELPERYEQIRFIKSMLWELYSANREIKAFIDENLTLFNGKAGEPESFNLLEDLLSDQYFRLAFWKVGTEEINYRRFFTVNELISVNMDEEKVFRHLNSLIFRLVRENLIHGLRIDHVDGLYYPMQYLKRLRDNLGNIYLVVEKILKFSEDLAAFWPIQGTTGYDFLNYVNGIFCRRHNEIRFDKIYYKFTDFRGTRSALVHEKKRLIIGKHMAGDVDNLARIFAKISGRHRYGSDFTLYGLKRALVEILSWFPIYRTYINPQISRRGDNNYIQEAADKAKKELPDFTRELDFIKKALLMDFGENINEQERTNWYLFIMRFQQITGSLMAKGFEDTVLYIYNRLLSLNEVGGEPDKFGISDIEFHYFNKKKVEQWPHSMNATSTHDTKRSEDVRARINVLSEIPIEWERNVQQWSRINRRKKQKSNGLAVPDKNDEYFLYQTLVGTFPFTKENYGEYIQRIRDYIIKSVREAKVHTGWLKPDLEYEEAFIKFVDSVLEDSEENDFLKEFKNVCRRTAVFGIYNSLAQILVKITAPGVPDFYQGTELWDFSLVDPDNRRPVDFEKRRHLLQEIKTKEEQNILSLLQELLDNKEDGRIKLFLIYRLLKVRYREAEVFQNGSYIPLETGGKHKHQVISFARNYQKKWTIAIATRFLTEMVSEDEYPLGTDVWGDTWVQTPAEIPIWENAITSQKVEGKRELKIGTILQHFPEGFLTGEER